MGRLVSDKIRKEREDIVCRMKLEGWTGQQIAGYIGVGRGSVASMIVRLKKEGRLPNRALIGTKNPSIGVGYNRRGKIG